MSIKKIIATVSCLAIGANSVAVTGAFDLNLKKAYADEAEVYPTGDLDGDGSVNSMDAVLCLKEYSNRIIGSTSSLSDEQIKSGDVDNDTSLTSKDAVIILQYYAFTLVTSQSNVPMKDFVEQDVPATTIDLKVNKNSSMYDDTLTVSWNSTNADAYRVYVISGSGEKSVAYETSATSYNLSYYQMSYYFDWQRGFSVGVSRVKNGIEYSMDSSSNLYNDDFAYWYSGSGYSSEAPYETLKKATKTNRNNTYKVREVDESGNVISTSTAKIPKKNIDAINKFMTNNFKSDWSDELKVFYTFWWIHYMVDYDYDYDISMVHGLSDAIFNYKSGQCLQYNGALVELMTYLGYEMVLEHVPGHYTGYVIINGREYNMETGNYGKNGEWHDFVFDVDAYNQEYSQMFG